MDPLCHTLAGAALAQTGLRRRTAMAGSAFIIGANLPDVDVISYFWGETAALSFRRGWTHGVLALLVWPLLLTGSLILWERWRKRPAPLDRLPLRPRALLAISGLAVLTHPILDTLNVYGVRWLTPFSDRWFYGDTLFIVDPWLWVILGLGAWLGARYQRRRGPASGRPAALALGLATGYILAMAVVGRRARMSADLSLREAGRVGDVLLAAPEPFNPFRRSLVAGDGQVFWTGEFDALRGRAEWVPDRYQRLDPREAPEPVREAADRSEARRFLSWARFPTARVRDGGSGRVLVDFLDLRYAMGPGTFGALTVALERRTPTPSEP